MIYQDSLDKTHSLYERICRLRESLEWSDCSFHLGDKTIKAHRLILGISSPVFKAMLYGPMASCHNINVPDIDPNIFQLLLDYIYTDKIKIESLEECCNLLYAAKKYMMDSLIDLCVKYLKNALSIDNVEIVFNYSEYMQEKGLLQEAINLSCLHADVIIRRTNEIPNISFVKFLLSQQKLNAKEKVLIESVSNWIENYCNKYQYSMTTQDKRNFLINNNILPLMRFLSLTLDDFEELADIKNLLTKEEIMYISEKIRHPEKMYPILSTISENRSLRTEIKTKYLSCHREKKFSCRPIIISESVRSIELHMRCNKSIFVNGFIIPTRNPPSDLITCMPPCYTENLNISLHSLTNEKSKSRNYKISKTLEYSLSSHRSFTISIESPYLFEKNEWYSVQFSWEDTYCNEYVYTISKRDSNCYLSDMRIDFIDGINNTNKNSFVEAIVFSK